MNSERSEMKVVVVGLGYVGLPVAASFAAVDGITVWGVDKDPEKDHLFWPGADLSSLKLEPGLAELVAAGVGEGTLIPGSFESCQDADAVIVCVPTPVDENHKPDNSMLVEALAEVGGWLRPDTLLCIESTLAPGTMTDVIIPTLDDYMYGLNCFLAYCPERLMPGVMLEALSTMPRVIGGTTPEATERACKLYERLGAPLFKTDAATAEVVKTAENASRDVNIAFANELCEICDEYGVNFWDVRRLINERPGRNILKAGLGVGGHCIPKDPWLLIHKMERGWDGLIKKARWSNRATIPIVLGRVMDLEPHKVAILGVAYKPDTDDARNSPPLALGECLKEVGVEVIYHDPHVKGYRPSRKDMTDVDVIVMAVDHKAYKRINWDELDKLVRNKAIVCCFEGFDAPEGWTVRTLGVPYREEGA